MGIQQFLKRINRALTPSNWRFFDAYRPVRVYIGHKIRGPLEKLPVRPAFRKNGIAITMQANDHYAPYASVTIRSILDHISSENNYDIIVTSRDMTEENAAILCAMADPYKNVSIRVAVVKEMFERLIPLEDAYYGEVFARLFLTELLPDYDKVLNLDCDMIVCADLAELYSTDMANYYMAAVQDLQSYISYYSHSDKVYFSRQRINGTMKLNSIENYHNVGVMLLNLPKIKSAFTVAEMVGLIRDNQFRFLEQDAFNSLFRGAILSLDWKWNWQCDANHYFQSHIGGLADVSGYRQKFEEAKERPKIIHYLTHVKPWTHRESDCADIWWQCAVSCPFYDVITDRHGNSTGTAGVTSAM